MASRSSATFLPEKSSGALDAAAAALSPALRAPFAAVCCRPRALPPAFAARLRAGVLADEDRLEEAALVVRGLRAPLDLDAVDLRAVAREPEPEPEPEPELEPRALDLRALDPPDRDDADLLELLFRDDELRPDPRPEDDPPPLPPVDSAISSPPQEASRPTWAAPDYLMPSEDVTYA
jgi:hypothetical protein